MLLDAQEVRRAIARELLRVLLGVLLLVLLAYAGYLVIRESQRLYEQDPFWLAGQRRETMKLRSEKANCTGCKKNKECVTVLGITMLPISFCKTCVDEMGGKIKAEPGPAPAPPPEPAA
jgi:hypothetical protein